MTIPADIALRLIHLEDYYAIKRVQHQFGYHSDAGESAQAAELFTVDGELAVGPELTLRGREQIREYLHRVLHPRGPLGSAHCVHVNLQLMPVVTVAPDGRSARATWRNLGFGGGRGEESYWTEGPQENEYVKTPQGWRIRRLHWYRSLHVPYEGGWLRHGDSPPVPDLPGAAGTLNYETWPAGATSSFHFADSVNLGELLTRRASDAPPATAASEPDLTELAPRIHTLAALRDLENLQGMFGYYLDKGQWQQAANLFVAQGRLVIDGSGGVVGRDRIHEFFAAIGPAGASEGRLLDVMQLQPVIDVDVAAGRARGRWRIFAQLAQAGSWHEWGTGIAEVDYVHTEMGWRIAALQLTEAAVTDYDLGWSRDLRATSRMTPKLPADVEDEPHAQPVALPPDQPPMATPVAELPAVLARAEDALQIERTQYIYGYCLATFAWETLTDLFAENGTIEVALRGIYRGKASIRRSLDLYGEKPEHGVLHNHMQMQPVIHIRPDGTATLRARALSMMGVFHESARWMGGLYENEFTKVGPDWKFIKDHVVNTYFAPYEIGWKDLPQVPPPPVSETNPPDSPPSLQFAMYPRNYFLPYSYPDPQPVL